jgi:hypothetical protein
MMTMIQVTRFIYTKEPGTYEFNNRGKAVFEAVNIHDLYGVLQVDSLAPYCYVGRYF